MENDMYRFLSYRNTSILDNIKRYCISENKNEGDVIAAVFYFMIGIKELLDESFVKACLSYIFKDANDLAKKSICHYNASIIRSVPEMQDELLRLEGKQGDVTKLLFYALNSNDTNERIALNLSNAAINDGINLRKLLLASLYTSEDSGVVLNYINYMGEACTHIYTRGEFIVDYGLINVAYNELSTSENSEIENIETLLNIPGADIYINKAINAGIITNNNGRLVWNKTKVLLSYFAENISGILNLGNKIDRDGDVMVNWKITECTFGENNLKGAKNDYMKSKDKFKPRGHNEIDNIFR